MALTTFGAIMGFAAEIVKQAEEVYRALAAKAESNILRQVLEDLSVEEGKNHVLMVRTRRENVTEMILEPVSGLHQENYEIDLNVLDQKDDGGVLNAALTLEERGRKFFQDASAKVPLPEVANTFRRVTHKKEKNLFRLEQLLASNQTSRGNT